MHYNAKKLGFYFELFRTMNRNDGDFDVGLQLVLFWLREEDTILGTWKECSEPMVAVVTLKNQTYCSIKTTFLIQKHLGKSKQLFRWTRKQTYYLYFKNQTINLTFQSSFSILIHNIIVNCVNVIFTNFNYILNFIIQN